MHMGEDAQREACQIIGLELLDRFSSICDRHGIEYYLDAGTLLGAFRYGGWIPWDDDVDVLMHRHEYERFRALASRELPGSMRLYDPVNDKCHVTLVPRVNYLPSSLYWEENWGIVPPERQRVVLDVYLLDRSPESRLAKLFWLWATRVLQGLSVMRGTHPLRIWASTPRLVSRLAGLTGWVFAGLCPPGLSKRMYVRIATAFRNSDSTDYHALNHSRAMRDKPLNGAWFGDERLAFCGSERPVPSPEPYLQALYGPGFVHEPPPSQRRGHHYERFQAQFGDRVWRA